MLEVIQYASQLEDSTRPSARQAPQSPGTRQNDSPLESLAANETPQAPAMERFIETLTALIIMRYEEEIEPDPTASPAGVLKSLMEEHGLRQVDLVPVLGAKSYVSQILSGHRPIGKEAAAKLAEFIHVKAHTFF